jgi:hypothetical protein
VFALHDYVVYVYRHHVEGNHRLNFARTLGSTHAYCNILAYYELPFTRNEGLVPGTVQQYSTVYVQCRTVQNKVSFAGGASFVGGEISLLYEIGTVRRTVLFSMLLT